MKNKILFSFVLMCFCTTVPSLVLADSKKWDESLNILVSPITVETPNNDQLLKGDSYTISWDGQKNTKYRIILEDSSGQKVGIIAENVKGSSYKWKVGEAKIHIDGSYSTKNNVVTTGKYKIRVTNANQGSSMYDATSDTILIASKYELPVYINLETHNNAKKWPFNKSNKITWDSNLMEGVVEIALYTKADGGTFCVIGYEDVKKESFTFKPKDNFSCKPGKYLTEGQYVIQLRVGNVSDMSDSPFMIK
jgi:hypothetical protein